MPHHRPATIEEALSALARAPGARLVAGGTDVYPGLRDGPPDPLMIDIADLPALAGVEETPEGWRIGAGVTWSALEAADLPPCFDGLKAAAREIGSVQIQNVGTLAGNLCNASPAADGAPALMALDAEVALIGPEGARRMAVEAFIEGPRRTALRAGEIMTAIHVPRPPAGARSSFQKLGARKHLVISIAMVAAVAAPGPDGRVARAAVAVGACSARAARLRALEAALIGREMTAEALAAAATEALVAPALAPIDDVRAPAAYRLAAATVLTRRALAACAPAAGEA